MKYPLSALLILISFAVAQEEIDFDKIDPGTHSDVPYIRQEAPMDTSRLSAYLQERLRILSAVQDCSGAGKAVELLQAIKPSSLPPASADCPPVNVLQMGIAAENNRLRDAFFYGEPKLAVLLNFSPEDAILPSPLTEEDSAQIKAEISKNFALLPVELRAKVDGGPGLTKESAWIMKETNFQECHLATNDIAVNVFDDWKIFSTKNEIDGSRRYLVYSVTLQKADKTFQVEQWFDITASRRVYTSEEQQKAMQQIVTNLSEMQRLMIAVADRKSADEAAVHMTKLIKEISPLHEIAQTKQTETRLMNNLTPSFDYDGFRKAIRRHHENDYYGSEALRNFIKMLHGPQNE